MGSAETELLYGDDGRVVAPATGLPVGTYPLGTSSYYAPTMTPDSSLGSAFFAILPGSYGSWPELRAYDLTEYFRTRTLTLPYYGNPANRLLRFGPDGVALIAGEEVVLVRGPFVLPVSTTTNPVPTVASIAPSSALAGSGNFRLTVTGTDFVPGSVVQWGGLDRSTRFVSATELVAFIPASDVATAGTPQVAVTSPVPGGGTSGTVTFTVN